MERVPLYLIAYFLLLAFGVLVLRRLVPREYRVHGRLSPLVALLQALLFFAYGGFPYVYLEKGWPETDVPPFARILGMALVFAGIGTLFLGMIRLGIARSVGRGKRRLITSGLYRYSRNPQAIACGLYVFGFTVLWPSGYAVGWALLYGILIHLMVLAEEQHLRRTFGREYAEFCNTVPRYLGVRALSGPSE